MTDTATMNLCKVCWHVTDLDHCPGCGAGEHNRGANSPFLVGLTREDIIGEMVRARDRVAWLARGDGIDWLALDDEERADTLDTIGAFDGADPDIPAGPWLTVDNEDALVRVGCWVTEYLHDDDDYVADGPDAWSVEEVVIPIGGTS